MSSYKLFSLVVALVVQGSFASDLFQNKYPSGFKASGYCEELLFSEIGQLSVPLRTFKGRLLADKIRSIHSIVHASEHPPSLNADQLQALAQRLRVISEASMTNLVEYSDELLVIGMKLGGLIETKTFPESAVYGFVDLLEDILLLPADEEQVRMMARAGVQANLAHVKLLRMKYSISIEKAKALDEATRDIIRTMDMGFQAGGQFGTKWLLLPFDAIKLVIQQFEWFDPGMQPRVQIWIADMLKRAFDLPEEMFLRDGKGLPKEVSDLALALYQMPRTKEFPEVYSRCAKFLALLDTLAANKP